MDEYICDCGRKYKIKGSFTRHRNKCPIRKSIIDNQIMANMLGNDTKDKNEGNIEEQPCNAEKICEECAYKDAIIAHLKSQLEAKTINNALEQKRKVNPLTCPNMSHINHQVVEDLFRIERVLTPMKLIELIWINKDYPENFSMFALDAKKDEIHVFREKTWKKEPKSSAFREIRKIVYDIVLKEIPHMRPGGAVNPTIIEQFKINATDESLFIEEFNYIQRCLIENSPLLLGC